MVNGEGGHVVWFSVKVTCVDISSSNLTLHSRSHVFRRLRWFCSLLDAVFRSETEVDMALSSVDVLISVISLVGMSEV